MANIKPCTIIMNNNTIPTKWNIKLEIFESKEKAIERAICLYNRINDGDKANFKVFAGMCNINESSKYFCMDDEGFYDECIYETLWDSIEEKEG